MSCLATTKISPSMIYDIRVSEILTNRKITISHLTKIKLNEGLLICQTKNNEPISKKNMQHENRNEKKNERILKVKICNTICHFSENFHLMTHNPKTILKQYFTI